MDTMIHLFDIIPAPPESTITKKQAATMLSTLIDNGWLLGVQVFGVDDCCEHGDDPCPADGFGLCDNMNQHSPGGSDCNRAERFLMRPHDLLMTNEVAEAIADQ